MKKIIFTTLAVSIAIISACTPTTTPSPTASVNGLNPVASPSAKDVTPSPSVTTGKPTRTQVLKFMDCLLSKADSVKGTALAVNVTGMKYIYTAYSNMTDASFDKSSHPEEAQSLAQTYAPLGCTL